MRSCSLRSWSQKSNTASRKAADGSTTDGCSTPCYPLYGPIRADLEKRGRLIGPYDLMIAAHARSVDAVLVTDNTKEFGRVGGLKTVNWLA